MKKLKLTKIKYLAYELRRNYQIPYNLMLYIERLDKSSSQDLVKLLLGLCEHYTRTKGYYKKYPLLEKDANLDIENAYKNFCGQERKSN